MHWALNWAVVFRALGFRSLLLVASDRAHTFSRWGGVSASRAKGWTRKTRHAAPRRLRCPAASYVGAARYAPCRCKAGRRGGEACAPRAGRKNPRKPPATRARASSMRHGWPRGARRAQSRAPASRLQRRRRRRHIAMASSRPPVGAPNRPPPPGAPKSAAPPHDTPPRLLVASASAQPSSSSRACPLRFLQGSGSAQRRPRGAQGPNTRAGRNRHRPAGRPAPHRPPRPRRRPPPAQRGLGRRVREHAAADAAHAAVAVAVDELRAVGVTNVHLEEEEKNEVGWGYRQYGRESTAFDTDKARRRGALASLPFPPRT
jgi:hypothetical protein